MKQPTVSVAVLTRNRLAPLQRCIQSIMAQLRPGDELVIGDTGSNDGTRGWLQSQSDSIPSLRLVLLEGSHDFARARNGLWRQCRGEVIAFTDDDCVVPIQWLERIRSSLGEYDAVGGPAIPARRPQLPRWWSPGLQWAVGMSPPGLVEQRGDQYPATSNLAVWRKYLEEIPFGATKSSLDLDSLYEGGREDAEWWGTARRQGMRICVLPQNAVLHDIPDLRYEWRYVMMRAAADGRAFAARRGATLDASDLMNDAALSLGRAICRTTRAVVGSGTAIPNLAWAWRQFHAARAVPSRRPPVAVATSSVAHMALATVRRTAGSVVATVAKARRAAPLPARPRRIAVIAPTYLGDTALLRSPLKSLCASDPDAEVRVVTRFPDLLEGVSPRLVVVNCGTNAAAAVKEASEWCDLAVVPYYQFGPAREWRRTTAHKGVTFASDVGFERRSDYEIAAVRHEKDFLGNEALNLAFLLTRGNLSGPLPRVPLVPDDQSKARAGELLAPLQGAAFVTVQCGSALPTKRWPVEHWASLLQEGVASRKLAVAFIGSAEDAADAAQIAGGVPGLQSVNCCGVTSIGVLGAVIQQSRCAIGPCSGPKHLAMSLGTPTFTLYGPSAPNRWGSLWDREIHGFVQSPVRNLTPSERLGLPENHEMLALAPEPVAAALSAHLDLPSHHDA